MIAAREHRSCFSFYSDTSEFWVKLCEKKRPYVCEYDCENPKTNQTQCPPGSAYPVPDGFLHYPSAGAYYRAVHVVRSLGRVVGLTVVSNILPCCPTAQPLLSIPHRPIQNLAEGNTGTAKMRVNPAQISDQKDHPVQDQ